MISHHINSTFGLRTYQYKQLKELLELTNLTNAGDKFLLLFENAQVNAHNPQRLMQIIHQIWNDPNIVPFLALKHCFKNKQLIVPVWHKGVNVFVRYLDTKSGGQRRLVIASPEQRLAMSIVNTIFQSSAYSWTTNTLGFRPSFGTKNAITDLSEAYINMKKRTDCNPVLVMFDLQKAYDSVHFSKLVNKLELSRLPLSLKDCIWRWHHPFIIPKIDDQLDGLPQGYNYCPTLFAWYLDKTVVADMLSFLGQHPYSNKPNKFVVYADNFAAVIDKNHLDDFLQYAKQCISSEQLQIKPGSLTIVNTDGAKKSSVQWLGYKLNLGKGEFVACATTKSKDGSVTKTTHTKNTFKDYKAKLQTGDWVNNVKSSNWR